MRNVDMESLYIYFSCILAKDGWTFFLKMFSRSEELYNNMPNEYTSGDTVPVIQFVGLQYILRESSATPPRPPFASLSERTEKGIAFKLLFRASPL